MIRGWGDLMVGGGGGNGRFGGMDMNSNMRRFEEQYHCYSVAFADKAHLEVRLRQRIYIFTQNKIVCWGKNNLQFLNEIVFLFLHAHHLFSSPFLFFVPTER